MTASSHAATRFLPAGGALLVSAGLLIAGVQSAAAAPTTIDLGTAAAASVMAGAGVTNTGASVLGQDLETWPTPAISGFPPGLSGPQHAADAVAQSAQSDLTTAYNAAAAAPSTNNETGVDLGGQTLTQGVYTASTAMSLTGPVPLTLTGSASSVFIFQAGSTLITGSASSVVLTGGVLACNVFWQVGSSATLGTGTSFQGNILALTSITVNNGSTIVGRALARNGAVTLDSDTFTAPVCTTATPPTTTPPTTAPPTTTPPTTGPVAVTPVTSGPSTSTTTPAGTTATTATTVAKGTGTTGTTGTAGSTGTAKGTLSSTSPGGGGATVLTSAQAGSLAFTGSNARPLLEAGGATILVGTAVVLLGRRRRAHS